MFTQAILRKPSAALVNGITSVDLGVPDPANALKQHAAYAAALESLGLKLDILESEERFPDSCFVEDVGLHTPHCMILCNPGAATRQAESALISARLHARFDTMEYIKSPGTLEGGDILEVGDTYYIGLSARTNQEGADQLIAILEKYGLKGVVVELKEFLHLKTGVSFIGDNTLLLGGELVEHPIFASFDKIEVDSEEEYASNSLWINGKVLMPAGFPKTKAKILASGREVVEVEVSEFQKVDGGLSCLSIRF